MSTEKQQRENAATDGVWFVEPTGKYKVLASLRRDLDSPPRLLSQDVGKPKTLRLLVESLVAALRDANDAALRSEAGRMLGRAAALSKFHCGGHVVEDVVVAVPTLIGALDPAKTQDPGIRDTAAAALAEFYPPPREAVTALVSVGLSDSSVEVVLSSLKTLRGFGQHVIPNAVPKVAELLEHEEESVCREAIGFLRVQRKDAVPALRALLRLATDKARPAELRELAAQAVAAASPDARRVSALCKSEDLRALIEMLVGPDTDVARLRRALLQRATTETELGTGASNASEGVVATEANDAADLPGGRFGGQAGAETPLGRVTNWQEGYLGLRFDKAAYRITREGTDTEVQLTSLYYHLLRLLSKYGESFAPFETVKKAWAEAGLSDTPEIERVRDVVSDLRKKIKPLGVTVKASRGMGYRLEPMGEESPPPACKRGKRAPRQRGRRKPT